LILSDLGSGSCGSCHRRLQASSGIMALRPSTRLLRLSLVILGLAARAAAQSVTTVSVNLDTSGNFNVNPNQGVFVGFEGTGLTVGGSGDGIKFVACTDPTCTVTCTATALAENTYTNAILFQSASMFTVEFTTTGTYKLCYKFAASVTYATVPTGGTDTVVTVKGLNGVTWVTMVDTDKAYAHVPITFTFSGTGLDRSSMGDRVKFATGYAGCSGDLATGTTEQTDLWGPTSNTDEVGQKTSYLTYTFTDFVGATKICYQLGAAGSFEDDSDSLPFIDVIGLSSTDTFLPVVAVIDTETSFDFRGNGLVRSSPAAATSDKFKFVAATTATTADCTTAVAAGGTSEVNPGCENNICSATGINVKSTSSLTFTSGGKFKLCYAIDDQYVLYPTELAIKGVSSFSPTSAYNTLETVFIFTGAGLDTRAGRDTVVFVAGATSACGANPTAIPGSSPNGMTVAGLNPNTNLDPGDTEDVTSTQATITFTLAGDRASATSTAKVCYKLGGTTVYKLLTETILIEPPPTPEPTKAPTPEPTAEPTTATPTAEPTTATPTAAPTTATPTAAPTAEPTAPTKAPTADPTPQFPTAEPTTATPTPAPTAGPTTAEPTAAPTTMEPTVPTAAPTAEPTPDCLMDQASVAGDLAIYVNYVSFLNLGDQLIIDIGNDNGVEEFNRVVGLTDASSGCIVGDCSGGRRLSSRRLAASGNIIHLSGPLTNAHAVGTKVSTNPDPNAGSDPVTRYRDKKVKFWLPNYQLMPLIRAPNVEVHGATFPGDHGDLQWFERFVVSELGGSPIVSVNIKRGIKPNRTLSKLGQFEQLDVTIRGASSPLVALDRPVYGSKSQGDAYQDYGFGGGLIRFRVGRQMHVPPRTYSNYFEYVYVQTPNLVFSITPAHAAVEYPDDAWKALQFSHLDMIVIDMKGEHGFTGILPELWGVIPLSEEVEAMTAPPEIEEGNCSNASSNGIGFDVEKLPSDVPSSKLLTGFTVGDVK